MKNFKNLLSYLLLSLTLFLAGCGGGGDAEPVLERKNAAHLSAGERAEFVDTLLRMAVALPYPKKKKSKRG